MHLAQVLAENTCNALDQQSRPCLVAICGWADTGKSTLAKDLCAGLQTQGHAADCISTDAFMKDRAERNAIGVTGYDPISVNIESLALAIDHFVAGEAFSYHPYDNRTGAKRQDCRIVAPGRVLVVEGIHALHPMIESRFSLKIFIDSDEQTLREMRRRANIFKRGMNSYDAASRIQKEWDDFCSIVLPRKRSANLVFRVNLEYEYSHPAGERPQ